MTPLEKALLLEASTRGPLLRKLLCNSEIMDCNRLVKRGLMVKGTSDDKQRTTQFVITAEGEQALKMENKS